MADIKKLSKKPAWHELTTAMTIDEGGTSKLFNTGEWTSVKPQVIEEECRQCLLCSQACPDSAIPIENNKRLAVDVDHCKGCGICVKICPFGAIKMEGVE